jgi:hypothetical protein
MADLKTAFDKATLDEKTAVFDNLQEVFSQDRKDLPENNKNSLYSQLASNSTTLTDLYKPSNIKIFLTALQENSKKTDNALYGMIDDNKLSTILGYLKDPSKVTIELDKTT